MFATKTLAAIILAAGIVAAAPVDSASCSGGSGGKNHGGKPPYALPNNGTYPGAPPPPTTTGTPTTGNTPSAPLPVDSSIVTHRVAVGLGGLKFEPNNVFALPGEIVEFKFLPRNHAVAQSSFDEPCKPLTDESGKQVGIFSGFNFATEAGLAPDVFQVKVTDTKPIWLYCPQTNGNHCQKGMAMSINQNPDSPKNLLAFIEKGKSTGTSVVPTTVQGGVQGPNPNPGTGFP